MKTVDVLAALDFAPLEGVEPIHLAVGHLTVAVLCADPLRATLAEYFSDAFAGPARADAIVEVLDGQRLSP